MKRAKQRVRACQYEALIERLIPLFSAQFQRNRELTMEILRREQNHSPPEFKPMVVNRDGINELR